jgi:hypothetical protein
MPIFAKIKVGLEPVMAVFSVITVPAILVINAPSGTGLGETEEWTL